MNTLTIILLLMIAVVFYGYFGYALLLRLITGYTTEELPDQKTLPRVTHIIAAYNEESTISDKISNALIQEYPSELLQTIVVTDGSSDRTEKIARTFLGVEVYHIAKRAGKSAAVNRVVPFASGEILIFSDADTKLNSRAVANLVRHFSDDSVGCVAGEKRVAQPGSNSEVGGEGVYWRYESFIKKLDSQFYTALGAAGELFAMRKELYRTDRSDFIIEDFVISMSILREGYRIAYEPQAYALERPTISLNDEYKRRVRIFAGAFQAIAELKEYLNPIRYPRVAFQFISHRILRWMIIPLLLPLILILSFYSALNGSIVSIFLSVGELLLLTAAFAGGVLYAKGVHIKLLWFPFYFIYLNLLPWVGLKRYLRSEQTTIWEKPLRQGGLL